METQRLEPAPPAPAHSRLGTLIDLARRQPGQRLLILLVLHFVVWTALPLLVCPNLQLDLAEDLALGREWQLGYWKHPPLPWWIADAVYRLTGTIYSVYLLGPLAAVLCFYGVWLLARDTVGPFRGLIAVAALEGVHYYNFSVVKFAHDQLQLPFWAFTAWFFHRALTRSRTADWLIAGVCLAGAFWSKYAVFALAISLGFFLLLDPTARRAWRTTGPYVMAFAFLVVVTPNVWWLIENDYLPLRYVDVRARVASQWWEFLVFPLRWTIGQLFFLLAAIALLTLLYGRRVPATQPAGDRAAFDRRYVAMLALGPFAVVTLVFGVLGRLPIAMWGYPLWSFAPLAVLMWWPPAEEMRGLRRFAAGAIAVTVAFPVIYAAIEIGEPFVRDRPKATEFPGRVVAAAITRVWRDRYGTPLAYVGGSEFATNNVAVYSPDRPRVIVHGDLKLSPWIDAADLARRGGVLVWEGDADGPQVAKWLASFGALSFGPPLSVPRQTFAKVTPVRVNYAFIPPKP
jgi:4-amino-4-deoxy-L-arabinose transferase-like glycosyltransferase